MMSFLACTHLLRGERLLLERWVQLVEPAQPTALAIPTAAQALQASSGTAASQSSNSTGRCSRLEFAAVRTVQAYVLASELAAELAVAATAAQCLIGNLPLQSGSNSADHRSAETETGGTFAYLVRQALTRPNRAATTSQPPVGWDAKCSQQAQRTCTSCTSLMSSCTH